MSKNYFRSFVISFFAISALMFGAFHYASANFFTDLFGGGNSASVSGSSSSSPLRVYNLRAYRSGSGTVASDDGKINCGSKCSQSYSQNTTVTLTASPAPGFTFMGWSTGWFDKSCPGTRSCTLTMNKSKYARAYFRNSKSASVTKKPQVSGDNVQGVSSSSSDSSISAKKYNLEVRKSGIGSVKSVPEGINCVSGQNKNNRDKNFCVAEFSYGQIVQLYATPDNGSSYETGAWGGDCRNTPKDSPCRLEMNKDRNATVSFDLNKGGYKLTVSKLGNGDGKVESINFKGGTDGVISCGADCSEDIKSNCENSAEGDRRCTSVRLKATAIGESTFGWWGVDCKGLTSAKNECEINMDKDKEVTVVFNEGVNNQEGKNYKLTVSPRPVGGTITNRNGSGRIDCGTSANNCSSNYGKDITVRLVATPDAGYKFSNTGNNWGGGCDRMIGSNECEVKMNKNRTISAVFSKISSGSSSSGISVTLTTGNPTNITSTSATINGTVNPKGGTKVQTWFTYRVRGSSAAFVSTAVKDVGGSSDLILSENITGLLPNTTYEYQINAAEKDNFIGSWQLGNLRTFTTLGDLGQLLNLPHLFIISDDNSSIAGEVSFTDKNGVKRTCSLAAKKAQCFYASGYFTAGDKVVLLAKGKSSGIPAAEFIASKSKDCVISKTISEKDTCAMTMRSSGDTQTATVKFSDVTGGLFNSSSSSSSGSSSLDLKAREVLSGGRFGEYSDSITLNNPNSEGTESIDLKWAVPSDVSNCSLTYSFNAQPLRWGQLTSSEIIAESGKDRTSNAYKHNTSDYNVTSSSRQTATYTLSCSRGGGKIIKAAEVIFGGN